MDNGKLAEKILERLCEKGLMDDLREFVGRKHKGVLLKDFSDAIEEVLNEQVSPKVEHANDPDQEAQDWDLFGINKI